MVKAFDINGNEIKKGNIVKIVKQSHTNHHWLRLGNTLRVAYWEDRTLGKTEYICVFLESKKGCRLCQLGVQDNHLEIVK